jgi:hypothetical protein
VIVTEQVQDAVHEEQPHLSGRVVRVVARRDLGRDHDVAEHQDAVLVTIVLVERERQHVGRPGLTQVALVQLGDLVGGDERHRQLGSRQALPGQARSREADERGLVDVERLTVRDEDPRGIAAVAHERSSPSRSARSPWTRYASTMSCTIRWRTTSRAPS